MNPWWMLGIALAQDPTAAEAVGEETPAEQAPTDAVVDDDGVPTKPRRGKLPQNPYAHTDFTAYTLEKGETLIGLTTVRHGVTERVQLGTIPLADFVGAWNINGKANVVRKERVDLALNGAVAVIPITDLINRLIADETGGGKNKQGAGITSSGTFFELGVRGSVRLKDKWSGHLGIAYARGTANGEIYFRNLPELVVPGSDTNVIPEEISIVPRVVGEAAQLRIASDYRFNRRDSLIVQFQAPMYIALRGYIDGETLNQGGIYDDLEVSVGYRDWIQPQETFAASVAWQFSWKHIDLRLGLGGGRGATEALWLTQAFDLTYRFGGSTRRGERDALEQYRAEKQGSDGGSGGD